MHLQTTRKMYKHCSNFLLTNLQVD